jgi:hypothetical protein
LSRLVEVINLGFAEFASEMELMRTLCPGEVFIKMPGYIIPPGRSGDPYLIEPGVAGGEPSPAAGWTDKQVW